MSEGAFFQDLAVLMAVAGVVAGVFGEDIPDVASWVVPHSIGPRFPGPLLRRTRCPDTSPNSTL